MEVVFFSDETIPTGTTEAERVALLAAGYVVVFISPEED